MKYHSYLSSKCYIKKSKLGGLGVFARKSIRKFELIALWGGVIYSDKEVARLGEKYPHFLTHPFSVYEGFYMGPINEQDIDDAERFNHSCDPNAGVKGQIVVVARKNIKVGEEICFDYETTEIKADYFKCNCGSKSCRKIIDGNAWKNPIFQKKNKGYLSWYIEDKIAKGT